MLTLQEERLASPVGEVVVLTDGDGAVRVLDFADHAARMRRLLDRHYRGGGWRLVPAASRSPAADAVAAYFSGDLAPIDRLATATGGTDFQRSIWAALRRVPAGGTISYGALARAIGRPTASRAVGLANGANPIAIIVPCHRIVGASGALTGYGGGLARKRWLIDHEARHARADPEGERNGRPVILSDHAALAGDASRPAAALFAEHAERGEGLDHAGGNRAAL